MVGKLLKKLREDLSMTQKEFADILPISQSYLSKLENEQQKPNAETIEAISERLAIPHTVLIFLALDKDDIPEHKRELFADLQNVIYEQARSLQAHAKS